MILFITLMEISCLPHDKRYSLKLGGIKMDLFKKKVRVKVWDHITLIKSVTYILVKSRQVLY